VDFMKKDLEGEFTVAGGEKRGNSIEALRGGGTKATAGFASTFT